MAANSWKRRDYYCFIFSFYVILLVNKFFSRALTVQTFPVTSWNANFNCVDFLSRPIAKGMTFVTTPNDDGVDNYIV